ncbi:MAG: hypothetical protein V2A54_08590 [Bacteroidota bacterium]
MKKLKILICSICAGCLLPLSSLQAQNISVRGGIYDFTDMTASEVYRIAPTVQAGLPLWKRNQLCMEALPGFSFKSKRYNEHHHYLYMFPVMFSLNYSATNSDAKVYPVFSAGATLLGKADHNVFMEKTIYAFTYGFNAGSGIRILCKNNNLISFTLSYNLLIPPVMEKINPSGVMIMLGYHFKNKE